MTENENNLDIARTIPLQENNNPENFYAGANRGEVLLRMTEALEQGTALLVLTGDEGSGKTVICRLLEREAAKFCFTVFLTKSVESFEDVVKKIAMWLGLASDGGYDRKNIDQALDKIAAHLNRESTGLLIIFDEAENIYLATLERIRKMLDRITQTGARMHIVFSGRKFFVDNYRQLSICDFKNSEPLQFELAPLSEQETGEYLHGYAMEAENGRVFNDEIVRNIFSLAEGNFRNTNLLAEESLRTHGDDTSFMVLLENVEEEVGTPKRRRRQQARPNLLKRSAHYLPWVGGLGCAALLLFYLMGSGAGNRSEENADTPKEKVERTQIVEAEKPLEEQKAEEHAAATSPVASKTMPAEQDRVQESLSRDDNAAENAPLESLSDGPAPTGKISGSAEVKEGLKGSNKENGVAVVREPAKTAPAPATGRISPQTAAKVTQLRLDKPLKIKKDLAGEKGSKGSINGQPPAVKEAVASKAQLPVDQLLQKRMAAGSAWTKKGKEDAYTMQLMALTDKNAEDNLKKMLAQPQYRQESEHFYIFNKKSAASTTVFVFYGEYPSLAVAREAQTTLPAFLRGNQPYAISIKGAMEKVKK